MSLEKLAERAKYLQEQVQQAGIVVTNLSNQLQQATVHMHTINGHFNEVAYLLGESQKNIEDYSNEFDSDKEQQDGETDI